MTAKPILCLDFDGVVHDYRHGWKDGTIYGDVVPGFFPWANAAITLFTLVIHSSRAKTEEGRKAIQSWLFTKAREHDSVGLVGMLAIVAEKPPAYITIDDRCIRFDGDWGAEDLYPPLLKQFRPWMAKEDAR